MNMTKETEHLFFSTCQTYHSLTLGTVKYVGPAEGRDTTWVTYPGWTPIVINDIDRWEFFKDSIRGYITDALTLAIPVISSTWFYAYEELLSKEELVAVESLLSYTGDVVCYTIREGYASGASYNIVMSMPPNIPLSLMRAIDYKLPAILNDMLVWVGPLQCTFTYEEW